VDTPAEPDDALAQPTRSRLFNLLQELRRPAGTEELAAQLALHPNGVRTHLEHLRGAGLIERKRTRQARGRPRDMWVISPDARPGGRPPTGYADLGRWLARVVAPGRIGLRAVEATGRQIGRELGTKAAVGPAAAEESMHAGLVSLGFQPRRETGPGEVLTYRLCNCPYRDAVRENQAVICTLHRGITRGLLDTISPETELAGFVIRDPDRAGCRIELRGGIADNPIAGAAPGGPE
jgi:predicted ArsR family transcriptional regulator